MQTPKILPPHYFLASLILIVTIASFEPFRLTHWFTCLGALPILAGLILAVFASRQFSKAGTNIVPLTESTALVTDGMFRVSRNPMYLGMTLVLAGTALMMGGAFCWLIVAAFVAIIRQRFILREEPLMQQTFGEAYTQYLTEVRRWL